MSGPSTRMLALLSLLQAGRDWPGEVLAGRLNVTPRTIRRDVDRLRELGYRISAAKGPTGGYRLVSGSELPPLLFDDEQAIAIAIALQTVPTSGVLIGESAERALATVSQVMPARLRNRMAGLRLTGSQLADVRRDAEPDPAPAALPLERNLGAGPGVDPATLERVSHATRDRLVLRFDYDAGDPRTPVPSANQSANRSAESGASTPTGNPSSDPASTPAADPDTQAPFRRAEPHGLVVRHGKWYLAAWDLDRDDWRVFRVDRMRPRSHPGPRFMPRRIPTGSAATFVDARAKGAAEQNQWPCVGRVEIDLPVGNIVPWLRDGSATALTAITTLLTVGSWSWAGLLADVLRFDAPFRVVDPPELAHAATLLASRLGRAASPPPPERIDT